MTASAHGSRCSSIHLISWYKRCIGAVSWTQRAEREIRSAPHDLAVAPRELPQLARRESERRVHLVDPAHRLTARSHAAADGDFNARMSDSGARGGGVQQLVPLLPPESPGTLPGGRAVSSVRRAPGRAGGRAG